MILKMNHHSFCIFSHEQKSLYTSHKITLHPHVNSTILNIIKLNHAFTWHVSGSQYFLVCTEVE